MKRILMALALITGPLMAQEYIGEEECDKAILALSYWSAYCSNITATQDGGRIKFCTICGCRTLDPDSSIIRNNKIICEREKARVKSLEEDLKLAPAISAW